MYPLHYGFVNFSGRATTYTEKIAVTCAKGYKIEGDREITCLGNSTWSTNTICKLAQGNTYDLSVIMKRINMWGAKRPTAPGYWCLLLTFDFHADFFWQIYTGNVLVRRIAIRKAYINVAPITCLQE